MPTSRNDCISGYYPNFDGVSGVKVYKNNLKSQVITGSVLCANVIYPKTHNLGKVPSVVIVTPWYALNQAKNFTSGYVCGEASVSAATSAVYYVTGNIKGAKFKAFLLI
jgi:hypothetical protein